ncbi:MAG: hypothetical protein D6731_18230 [Planctomycetota bacterium]|nr:MAG: hypothetical protein D6731_18230 [Planctomycetota bacterium]
MSGSAPALQRPAGAFLFVLAFLARLPGLGRSLGYDELFTLTRFATSPARAVGEQVAAANHPLASLFAWAAARFAEGEVGLRLPFVVLGALAAPALGASVARLAGRRAGFLAGALLALGPWPTLASQQVRGYAPLLLCAALLPGAVERLARARSSASVRGASVALTLVVALGFWAHATFVAASLSVSGAALLLAQPGRRARLAAALGTGHLAGLLLWAPILGRTWKFVRRSFGGELPTLPPGRIDGAAALSLFGGGRPGLGLLLFACAGLGAWALARRRQRSAALLCAPLVASGLLVLLGPQGYPRFLGFAVPSLLALVACAVALALPRSVGSALAAALLGTGVLSLAGQARAEVHDLRGGVRVARQRAAEFGAGEVLALGPGAELCPAYGPVTPDPEGVLFARRFGGPLVVLVPLPRWLDTRPALRDALWSRGAADPWVLPGLESPVAVFAVAPDPPGPPR